MTIYLTINNTIYSYDATSAQLAGLAAAHANVTAQLQPGAGQDQTTPVAQRPGYIADDVAWLTNKIQAWATTNPNGIVTTTTGTDASGNSITIITTFGILDMIAQCLNSWAGIVSSSGTITTAPLTTAQTQAFLNNYTNEKWTNILANGTVTVGGFQSGTDDRSRGFVSQTIQLMQLGNVSSVDWNGNSTTPITLAQLIALGVGLGAFVQAAFNANGTALIGIASGSITSTAQIDSLSWPTSS